MDTPTLTIKFILQLGIVGFISGLECVKKMACSCEMSDGSGMIDLSNLVGSGGGIRWSHTSSAFIFGHFTLHRDAYNPCTTFVPPIAGECPKRPVYLYNYELVKDGGHVVTNSCSILGTPNNVEFLYNEADDYATIQYKEGEIATYIDLRCNKTLQFHDDGKFWIRRINETTYTGSITSACACRNGCPLNIIPYVIFGAAALIVFILLVCAFGMVYKRCKGARGWEMIPFCGCKKKGYEQING